MYNNKLNRSVLETKLTLKCPPLRERKRERERERGGLSSFVWELLRKDDKIICLI